MVILGMLFIALMSWGAFRMWRGTLFDGRRYLKLMMLAVPLPVIACQFGWMATEVGRQPWIVYKLLRTSEAASPVVGSGEILFSIALFSLIYLGIGSLWILLMVREAGHDLSPAAAKEVSA